MVNAISPACGFDWCDWTELRSSLWYSISGDRQVTPVNWNLTVLHVTSSELHEGTHSMMAVRTEVPGDLTACFLRLGLHTDLSHLFPYLDDSPPHSWEECISSNEWFVCKAISNFAL